MDTITEKQKEYIKILSSYDFSKEEDEKDIADYLKAMGRQNLSELSKKEASQLIQILLKRPTEYTFICGRKAILNKQKVNSFNVWGEIEACMRALTK